MKVGSAVLGLHMVAVVAFSLTQGCVTSESKGSGRGAGAHHKGPWRHQHSGKTTSTQVASQDTYVPGSEVATESIYEPVITESFPVGTPVAYVEPVDTTTHSEVYIVQKGDILGRLATKFDTTTKTLISMNNLTNPDVLYVGQELRIPGGSRVAAQSQSPTKKYSTVKKGGEYEIQKGDTLSRIAVSAGVSIDDLRSLNNIQGDQIFAGDTIDIPSGGSVPSRPKKSTPKKAAPAPKAPAPVALEPAPAPLAPAPAVVDPVQTAVDVGHVIDHVVYPGETLADIARQYAVSKSDILRLNPALSSEFSIKEGQRLRIPISE